MTFLLCLPFHVCLCTQALPLFLPFSNSNNCSCTLAHKGEVEASVVTGKHVCVIFQLCKGLVEVHTQFLKLPSYCKTLKSKLFLYFFQLFGM